MKSKLFLLGAVKLLLASCSNELDVPVNQAVVGDTPLSINVLANPETKAIPGQVTGTALPSSSSIGVTLIETGTDDGLYDGNTYKNVEYKFTNGTSAIRNFRLKLASIPRKRESLISKFEVETMSASINVEFKLWLKKAVDSIDLYPSQNCASNLNQAI